MAPPPARANDAARSRRRRRDAAFLPPRATLAPTTTSPVGFSQVQPTTGFFDTTEAYRTFTTTIVVTSPETAEPRTSTVVLTITAPSLSTNSPLPPSIPASNPPATTTSSSPSLGSRNLTAILLGSILGSALLITLIILLVLLLKRRRRKREGSQNQIIETAEVDVAVPAISPLSFAHSDFAKTTIHALDRTSRTLSVSLDLAQFLELSHNEGRENLIRTFHPDFQLFISEEELTPRRRRPSSPYSFPKALEPRVPPRSLAALNHTPTIATGRSDAPSRSMASEMFYTPSSTASESSETYGEEGIPFPLLLPAPMTFEDEEEENPRTPQDFRPVIPKWSITDTALETPRKGGEGTSTLEDDSETTPTDKLESRWSADTPSFRIGMAGSRRASGIGEDSRSGSGESEGSASAPSKRSRGSRGEGSEESEGGGLRPARMSNEERRGSHGTFGGA